MSRVLKMDIYQLEAIETPRLIIRPVKVGDEKTINDAINRSLVDLQRWMPWAKDPSLDTTLKFVTKGDRGWHSGESEDFPMVTILKDSNCIISATGFNEKSNPSDGMYEIGYWIDRDYQGQGLVTEMVSALTRFALTGLQAKLVQVVTQVGNEKSVAVANRLGFTEKTILKNNCIDCLSGEPADSYLFTCSDITVLPELEVTWSSK